LKHIWTCYPNFSSNFICPLNIFGYFKFILVLDFFLMDTDLHNDHFFRNQNKRLYHSIQYIIDLKFPLIDLFQSYHLGKMSICDLLIRSYGKLPAFNSFVPFYFEYNFQISNRSSFLDLESLIKFLSCFVHQ
jgi:hypothetical protein